jgi:ATP-dependent Clp protease ATP-binding subunit ClpB
VFYRLTREDLSRIVDLQVEQMRRRLAARRLTLDLAPEARSWLAEHGYDPAYGARPLKRLIQKQISDRLASALLEGRFADGDTVRVEAGEEGLRLVDDA